MNISPLTSFLTLVFLFTGLLYQGFGGEVMTINSGQSEVITLAQGDVALLTGMSGGMGAETYTSTPLQITKSGMIFSESPWLCGITGGAIALKPVKIAGPATLSLSGNNLWATFDITRAGSAGNAIPANAVVIPEDAGGQFQVILESSTDLITWTAATPGTYGGSTTKRFFRTRIVRN